MAWPEDPGDFPIRIPANIIDTVNKVVRTSRQMLPELGREPTPEELAESLAMPPEKRRRVLEIARQPTPWRLGPAASRIRISAENQLQLGSAGDALGTGGNLVKGKAHRDHRVIAHQADHVRDTLMAERLDRAVVKPFGDPARIGEGGGHLGGRLFPLVLERF